MKWRRTEALSVSTSSRSAPEELLPPPRNSSGLEREEVETSVYCGKDSTIRTLLAQLREAVVGKSAGALSLSPKRGFLENPFADDYRPHENPFADDYRPHENPLADDYRPHELVGVVPPPRSPRAPLVAAVLFELVAAVEAWAVVWRDVDDEAFRGCDRTSLFVRCGGRCAGPRGGRAPEGSIDFCRTYILVLTGLTDILERALVVEAGADRRGSKNVFDDREDGAQEDETDQGFLAVLVESLGKLLDLGVVFDIVDDANPRTSEGVWTTGASWLATQMALMGAINGWWGQRPRLLVGAGGETGSASAAFLQTDTEERGGRRTAAFLQMSVPTSASIMSVRAVGPDRRASRQVDNTRGALFVRSTPASIMSVWAVLAQTGGRRDRSTTPVVLILCFCTSYL